MSDKTKIIISISAIIGIVVITIFGLIFDTKNREIKNNNLVSEVIYKTDSLQQVCDSLNSIILQDEELIEYYKKGIDNYIIIVDSLNEELLFSNAKLERIKEYNRIAGQGNNITFLRGWINRVLNQ